MSTRTFRICYTNGYTENDPIRYMVTHDRKRANDFAKENRGLVQEFINNKWKALGRYDFVYLPNIWECNRPTLMWIKYGSEVPEVF